MESIKVSVIIPVYNVSKYLRQCLDSVVLQTLTDIEIICVDDGSTDNSLDILYEYSNKDKRFKVIRQDNCGAGKARNTGLKVAKGKYLIFLDADDFSEKEMLEKAYQKAEKQNAEIVVFNSDQYLEENQEYHKVNWTIRKKELPPYRPMYFRNFTDNVFKVFVGWAWDKLFLRDFVIKHELQFQEIRTSNDMRFVFMAIVLAKRIDIVDEVLIHQRRNNRDSLSNTREKSWYCFHDALISLKDELNKKGLYRELEKDFQNYALHASIWNLTTIKGSHKMELYDTLKKEWFKEFGIVDKPSNYFYNSDEYEQYCKIMNNSYSKWEGDI